MPESPPYEPLTAARAAFEKERYGQAETLCRARLLEKPDDAEAGYLLGLVLQRSGKVAEAEACFRCSAAQDTSSPNACYALGCLLARQNLHADAVVAFEAALKRAPAYVNAWYALGNAYYELFDFDRSLAAFRRGVELAPADPVLWNNFARTLEALGRADEALAAYERAIQLEPEFSLARSNHALVLLSLGRLQEGFQEYEWRWRKVPARPYSQPFWRGQPIEGKTLLVCAEQGFGDCIQFARFVPQARGLCGRVILECQPALHRLFQHAAVADELTQVGAPPPAFDYYIPLMSLPLALGTTMETLPQKQWLTAPAGPPLPSRPAGALKVGLVWAGNPTNFNNSRRSLRFSDYAPFLEIPNTAFYSLQLTVKPEDEVLVTRAEKLLSPPQPLADFYDTAALIGQLDLVISVDTAVAHLAGSLGKPVWTLVFQPGDWRWLLGRSDSPWYPTMRLFRQGQPGNWRPVLQEVATELRAFAKLSV